VRLTAADGRRSPAVLTGLIQERIDGSTGV
jgi:hypothetical protein